MATKDSDRAFWFCVCCFDETEFSFKPQRVIQEGIRGPYLFNSFLHDLEIDQHEANNRPIWLY